MTGNQIAYWSLQETKRSNLMNEGLKRDQNTETRRSNLVKENQTNRSLYETERHNRRSEALGIANTIVQGTVGLGKLLV